MTDRFDEIKETYGNPDFVCLDNAYDDARWLIAEVERLREQNEKLERDVEACGPAYSAAVVMERDGGRNLTHNMSTVRKCLASAKAMMDRGAEKKL